MTTSTLTDLTALDRSDMLGAIAGLPDQLLQGHAAAAPLLDEVAARDIGTVNALAICGMGGSGVGADLLPAVFDLTLPVVPAKGYELPSWARANTGVVCVSYSGNTAETLA